MPPMRLLIDFPRWLFLGTLVYAPWMYGCTDPESIAGLNKLLVAVLALWSLGLAIRGEWPQAPKITCLLVPAILALGWGMTYNACCLYDPFFNTAVTLPRAMPVLPGSVERALSMAWMARMTTCLGSLLFVADLVRRPLWQLRLWWTLGAAGGSIALLGLAQKVTAAPMIFWQHMNPPVASFFATYFYHANGGAFLNLILPPVACLALRAITKTDAPGERVLWITALVITLGAEAVNTSRGAQAVALLLCAALLLWPARTLLIDAWQQERRTLTAALCFGLAIAAAIILSIGLDAPLTRWRVSLSSPGFRDDAGRWLAAGAGLHVVPDAGWFGFGPGTFRVVFPYYTGYLGDRISGIWKFLHEDYIQTVIEWGWVGAVLWAVLYFAGIGTAVRAYRRNAKFWSGRQRLLLCSAVLALVGTALHSLLDFPMQIASLQLLCAVYLGICWSSVGWTARRDHSCLASARCRLSSPYTPSPYPCCV